MIVKTLTGALLLCFFLVPSISLADRDVWLLIDTQTRNLEIKKGEQTLEVLEHVVIGRKGAGTK